MSTLAWAEAAARSFEPPTPKWPTPGDLAQQIDPRIVQTPALDLMDAELVRAFNTPDGRLIWAMPPQEGKALALDTPIATPTGWTTMGALRTGDEVIGGDGRPCRVTWVSPVWHGHNCYAVTTGDGERIIANAQHEWVAKLDRRRSTKIVTTDVLAMPRSKNAQITATELDLPLADLLLDPYVLGAWLGDGNTRGARITIHPDDRAILDRIEAAGFPAEHQGRYSWSLAGTDRIANGNGRRSVLRDRLVRLGVWGDKHIPDDYLRAGRTQRLALLQGLIDTDGYVSPKGQVEFCSTNRRLAEGVRELVYSLGAKAVMSEGHATIDGRDCGMKYRVKFYLADAAHLPRKAERCKDSSVGRVRYVSAEPVESVATVCIEVDSPDHTYLAGRTMLPTHNSDRVMKFIVWALTQNPDLRIINASYAQGLANRNGRSIRNTILAHPETGLQIAPDNGAAHEWQIAGHDGGVLAVGRGAGATGRPCDLLIIDDPIKDRQEADSEVIRQTCIDWWTDVLSTRLAPGATVVLIQTRWHQGDLAGYLLSAPDGHLWRHVNVPAQADHNPDKGETDPLDRQPGEFMQSARRRTEHQWEAIKVRVGSRTWNALYQGRPSPAEGGIIKRGWWRYYQVPLWIDMPDGSKRVTGFDLILQSWDLTFKDSKASDFVVGQVWGAIGADIYLLDQVRGRWDFPETQRQFKALSAKWPDAVLKIVEEKANGAALIASLQREIGGIVPENPTESKVARTHAVAPLVEARNVNLPDPELAPWIGDFVEEWAAFPNGANDDQVDGGSQALKRLGVMPLLLDQIVDDEDEYEHGWSISPM